MSRLNEIKRRLTAANDNRYRWARFTIHAPDDIDYLLAEVERLRAVERDATFVMADLYLRVEDAARELRTQASDVADEEWVETVRLRAKASGVERALGYVSEAIVLLRTMKSEGEEA